MKLKKLAAILIVAVMTLQPAAVFAATEYKSRDEIPDTYKGAFTDIYKTSVDFQNDLNEIEKVCIPELLKYKGRLNNKDGVLECLKIRTKTNMLVDKAYNYAILVSYLDINAAASQNLAAMAQTAKTKAVEAASFIEPELISSSAENIEAYMNDPDFKDYSEYFRSLLRRKPHILTKNEESLLSQTTLFSGNMLDTFFKLSDVETRAGRITDSEGTEISLANIHAAMLSMEVNKNLFFALARNYASAVEAALLPNGIPVSVYDNLINTTGDNLKSLHRYVRLVKDMPPVTEYTFDLNYEEAKKLTLVALKPLGNEYSKQLQKAFNENWVDVYTTPGKISGACCERIYGVHPFVLLNYTGEFRDASDLSHEMGHAMHAHYTGNAQPFDKTNMPAFTAEVASTVNEIIFTKYLIENAKTNEEKIFFIGELINLYESTFFAQVKHAEFEKEIHKIASEGGPLSAESLNSLWLDLEEKYSGISFEGSKNIAAGWSRIPHFYMNFYAYQYATGIAAANKLAGDILANKPGAQDRYMAFLSSGASQDPITTLKNAGVDMNTTAPFSEFIKEFDSLVTEMETLLKDEGVVEGGR